MEKLKPIILKATKEVEETTDFEITEKLYNKILEELNVDPKVPFKQFYESAIGNELLYPYVDYDHELKEGYYWHDVDYYDGSSMGGYVEPGMKRRRAYLDTVIKYYLTEKHPEVLHYTRKINKEYSKIDVPTKEKYYK